MQWAPRNTQQTYVFFSLNKNDYVISLEKMINHKIFVQNQTNHHKTRYHWSKIKQRYKKFKELYKRKLGPYFFYTLLYLNFILENLVGIVFFKYAIKLFLLDLHKFFKPYSLYSSTIEL